MVPPKRTNSRWLGPPHNQKPKIDVEKFIMFTAHTICLYLLCVLCWEVGTNCAQGCNNHHISTICTRIEWEKVRKAIFILHMHSMLYAMVLLLPLLFFCFCFVCDEVEVLLSFCGVIVSDIFHVLFSSVKIFPYTAEPTASSQKWRNATQKVKLQIDDESENHFV